MKNSPLDSEIRSRIDAFASDLANLVKVAALQSVHDALGAAVDGKAAPKRRGPGRPPKAAAAKSKPARIVRRGKRTPEDVAKTGAAVVAYVSKNPGQSVEQIGKAMGKSTKELALPIIRMVEAKKLKTTGQRRGTKYFAK